MKHFIAPMTVLFLSGCSVTMPTDITKEPIPAADPIIIDASSIPAEIRQNRQQPPSSERHPSEEQYYIVKKGDTVFEVMRQTGVDWRTIIQLNQLVAPKYTIYPDQKLRIK